MHIEQHCIVDVSDVVVIIHQWLKQNVKDLSSNNTFAHLLLNYAALISRYVSMALSKVSDSFNTR